MTSSDQAAPDEDATDRAQDAASHWGRRLEDNTQLRRAVRLGLVAYAATHLLVAFVAARLVVGDERGTATTTGALSALAGRPGGGTTLFVMAAGFVALALSRLLQAVITWGDEDGWRLYLKPAYAVLKTVLYGSLAWSALKVGLGGGSDGKSSDALTAQVLAAPGGQVLIVVVAGAIAAYAIGLMRTGVTGDYRDKLAAEGWRGDAGDVYDWIGRVGYLGKGLAFVLVAGLVAVAGLTRDPQQSGGLDQALHALLGQPFGRVGVGVVAVGLAAYGVFALLRARHLR